VRVDHTNVNGNGKIAELRMKIKSDVTPNSVLNVAVSNPAIVSSNGTFSGLTPSAPAVVNLLQNIEGIHKSSGSASSYFFPNPANEKVNLNANGSAQYSISDLSGRLVMNGSFDGKAQIDISRIDAGVYLLKIQSTAGDSAERLMINH
jgi:hypothetical protein